MPTIDHAPWITEETAKRLATDLPNVKWIAVKTLQAEGKEIPPFLSDVPETIEPQPSELFLEFMRDPGFARRHLMVEVSSAKGYVDYQRRTREKYKPKFPQNPS